MSELIVDSTIHSEDEKHTFLAAHPHDRIIMDFSLLDPTSFYDAYPQLIGSFPGRFAINGRCELHLRNPDLETMNEFIRKSNFTPALTSIVGLGFTIPRTLALIINEAFFALEEEVATASDIDRAMRFGVNYPQGPFEWARGREVLYVELLEKLQETTGSTRYAPATSLRARASKFNP